MQPYNNGAFIPFGATLAPDVMTQQSATPMPSPVTYEDDQFVNQNPQESTENEPKKQHSWLPIALGGVVATTALAVIFKKAPKLDLKGSTASKTTAHTNADTFTSRKNSSNTTPTETVSRDFSGSILPPSKVNSKINSKKVSSHQQIGNGYVADMGTIHNSELFALRENVKAKSIKPFKPTKIWDSANNTLIDVRIDPRLKAFLQSSEFKHLQSIVPKRNDSFEKEQHFFSEVSRVINKQFDHKCLSSAERDKEFSRLCYKEKVTISANGKTKRTRIYRQATPLGEFMEAGAGVCRHRALLTKVTLDQLGKKELKSSYKSGLFNENATADHSAPWKFNEGGGHAWNTVTMPSGRRYLFDAYHNNRVVPKFKTYEEKGIIKTIPNLQDRAQNLNMYASWGQLCTKRNPYNKKSCRKFSRIEM